VLSCGNSISAKVIAAALSGVISAASYALMHTQRGHAISLAVYLAATAT
jgi:hypothetical protein